MRKGEYREIEQERRIRQFGFGEGFRTSTIYDLPSGQNMLWPIQWYVAIQMLVEVRSIGVLFYLDIVRFIQYDTVKVDLVNHTLLFVNTILTLEPLLLLSVH